MVPSVDCFLSSLLCTEDATSIVWDDVENFNEFDHHGSVYDEHLNSQINNKIDFDDVFEALSEECLGVMINKECNFLPENDYLKRLKDGDLSVESRLKAISWIAKVHAHYNFQALCAYLSISYMDRFLSAYEIPKEKEWMIPLLAVACLSLAAKMEESTVPPLLDLQVGDCKFIFDAKTIMKMELLVLTTLKWRMNSVTPFLFIVDFVGQLNGGKRISRSLIDKSNQLILSTLKVIDFLEFRPSEIAAAVAISAIEGIHQMAENKAVAALFDHVRKEKVMQCLELIEDMKEIDVLLPNGNDLALQKTCVDKLGDCPCLSYIKDDSVVGSCATSTSEDGPIVKRRKRLYKIDFGKLNNIIDM
ncbi:kinase activator [Lithospermum erythrorhizon]|uniref:Kinase activator n=1 Tax=Lithospermum erythrorhizon TaxID=34254 RepID=A0AAV3RYI4_LITER